MSMYVLRYISEKIETLTINKSTVCLFVLYISDTVGRNITSYVDTVIQKISGAYSNTKNFQQKCVLEILCKK